MTNKNKIINTKNAKGVKNTQNVNVLDVVKSEIQKLAYKIENFKKFKFIEGLVVKRDNFEEVVSTLVEVNAVKNMLDVQRRKFVDPLNKQVKQINEEFKKHAQPLEEIDDLLREKLIDYRRQLSVQLGQGLTAQDVLKSIEGKATTPGGALDIPVLQSEVVLPSTVICPQGEVIFRRVKKWRVKDEKLIPRDYLTIDEKKVNEAVREGREIPGIEVYYDDEIAVKVEI